MIVMKFGGASLADSSDILRSVEVIKNYSRNHSVILVVSAMKEVTNQLYDIAENVKKKRLKKALQRIDGLKRAHITTLYKLQSAQPAITESKLVHLFSRLDNFIRYIAKHQITEAQIDFIVSVGERLSGNLMAESLNAQGITACSIDTSYVIATDDSFGNALPLPQKYQTHIQDILCPLINSNIIPIVSGFVGFAPDGRITTLGRGGSDLSASYLAYLFDAHGLYLWKDVNGIYSDDPHRNINARFHKKLSYDQAARMAKNGAKIIYHKAIHYVKKKKIPIYVKNYKNPHLPGTIVC